MIEHLKKIISSDLIINDKVYNVDDSLKFPWQWIANIELFLKILKVHFQILIMLLLMNPMDLFLSLAQLL